MAKVAVSKANLRIFCVGSCWALPLSLLLRCLALWRNANLAGGFAGRFLVVVLVVWLVSHDDLPEIFGPHESCTLLLFTAYAIVRTVPRANRPNRGKKKKKYMGTISHITKLHSMSTRIVKLLTIPVQYDDWKSSTERTLRVAECCYRAVFFTLDHVSPFCLTAVVSHHFVVTRRCRCLLQSVRVNVMP